jgi:hypothetical protein
MVPPRKQVNLRFGLPLALVALFLFVGNVSAAKLTLEQKRAVYDSLISSFSELTPIAALPKDWPPYGTFGSENKMVISDLGFVAKLVAEHVDPSAGEAKFFHSIYDAGPELPVRGTRHELGSEVGVTLLDSNDVLIRWRQNFREPLPVERVEKALTMTDGARCVILDLQEFDVYYVDSLLKALSFFAPDSVLQLTEVARVPHEDRDEYEEHRTTAHANAWCGPLVVMLRDTGWPGIGIKATFDDRAYTRCTVADRNREFLGYQYATVFLPEEYVVHVPTVVLMRKGKLLRIARDDFPNQKPDEREFGAKLETARKLIAATVGEYLEQDASFVKRLSWWWKDLWRESSEQTPQEMIIQ